MELGWLSLLAQPGIVLWNVNGGAPQTQLRYVVASDEFGVNCLMVAPCVVANVRILELVPRKENARVYARQQVCGAS